MAERLCVGCDMPLRQDPGKRGRPRKWCADCRPSGQGSSSGPRPESRLAPLRTVDCAECRVAFETRWSKQRFCTRKCQRKEERRRHSKERRHYVDLECSECGQEYRGCPPDLERRGHHANYCSAQCEAEGKRERLGVPCRHGYASHSACPSCNGYERKIKGPICRLTERPSVRRWIAGSCECGETFVGRWHPDWPCRYCSDRCIARVARRRSRAKNGRIDEARKRARYYGAEYEPVHRRKVFERDGYRCSICKSRTLRSKKVPHPRAPTVDHIIPMSKGGDHLYSNVQCACFRCNVLKGDGVANDQLRLAA